MNDKTNDAGGNATGGESAFTPDEEAFFASGGETGLNTEAGSDNAGGANLDPPKPGADKGGEGDKGNEKLPQNVPLAALHEERGKRKALGETVKSLEAQLAEFRGKFDIIARLKAAPGEGGEGDKPAGPPTVDEDIFGAVKHLGDKLGQMEKKATDDAAATKAKEEADAAERTFVTNYRNDAAAFTAKNADFKDAYMFLLNTRAQELIAIGFDDPNQLAANGADDEDVHAARKALHDALMADERGIAELAFSKKKSPAETIYGLAKQRGYAAKPAAATKGKGEEVLDAIERGQRENKSLSNTGGGSGEDGMTAERLIAMSTAEFEAWTAKHPAEAKRLFGG